MEIITNIFFFTSVAVKAWQEYLKLPVFFGSIQKGGPQSKWFFSHLTWRLCPNAMFMQEDIVDSLCLSLAGRAVAPKKNYQGWMKSVPTSSHEWPALCCAIAHRSLPPMAVESLLRRNFRVMKMDVEPRARCSVRPTVRNDLSVSFFILRLIPRVLKTAPKKDSCKEDAGINTLQWDGVCIMCTLQEYIIVLRV